MVLGIGCDIVEIKSIEKSIDKEAFLSKYFSEKEIELIKSRGKIAAQTAAGNFCAKEAVAKALGCGLGAISVKNIEILRNTDGAPYVILHGNGLAEFEKLGGSKIFLSISHSKESAVAYALLEG